MADRIISFDKEGRIVGEGAGDIREGDTLYFIDPIRGKVKLGSVVGQTILENGGISILPESDGVIKYLPRTFHLL